MKFLVMNGPNINMLGVREPDIYGKQDYKALCQLVRDTAVELGDEVELFQSNHEGALVDRIQEAFGKIDRCHRHQPRGIYAYFGGFARRIESRRHSVC